MTKIKLNHKISTKEPGLIKGFDKYEMRIKINTKENLYTALSVKEANEVIKMYTKLGVKVLAISILKYHLTEEVAIKATDMVN